MVKSRVLGGREGKSSHAEPPGRPEPSLTKHIIDLAKLVLELNAFQFEDGFYLQVHGTAMGTRMAPSYANIFMGVFEELMLATAPNGRLTLLFHRFIDDVFGVWIYGEEALMEFLLTQISVTLCSHTPTGNQSPTSMSKQVSRKIAS